LRVGGFGYPTRFFLRSPDGQSYMSNRRFCWQFYDRGVATEPHPLRFAAAKPAGTTRVFVLGESAAEGTPDPAFGFARILEKMLNRQYPQRRFEVVNAAVRGINSHIILPIARECAGLEPDLFVVYMGNNESVGLYTPRAGQFNLTPHLGLIRARQWVKSTKIAQAVAALARRVSPPQKHDEDMPYFRERRITPDNPERAAVYDNFRQNLADIGAAIRGSGAKAIVCSVAVNLRDFPPLASLHRPGLSSVDAAAWETAFGKGVVAEGNSLYESALADYKQAAAIDDHFADLLYREGRCEFALGHFKEAGELFARARDWDALEVRADSRVNEIIKAAATGGDRGAVSFLDAEQALAASPLADHSVPGDKLFHDHVHLAFDGDYLLANSLLPAIVKALGLGQSSLPVPTRQECADALAYTGFDEFNVLTAMAESTSHPPFLDQIGHEQRQRDAEQRAAGQLKAVQSAGLDGPVKIYQQALAAAPDDWRIHMNHAGLRMAINDPKTAASELQKVVDAVPESPGFRLRLAQALTRVGRPDEAAREIEEAFRMDPDFKPAEDAMKWVQSRKGGRSR
jgi:tetratricopeptide (TPR) repeat protein